jgi:hypothetical protein
MAAFTANNKIKNTGDSIPAPSIGKVKRGVGGVEGEVCWNGRLANSEPTSKFTPRRF